jgi:hypothetical protein
MTLITDRIERELGIPNLATLLAERLEPSDLQSLLLDVYRRVVMRRATPVVLADYATNRFVRPSAISPRKMLEWDRVAYLHLPSGFEAVDLSPVCPLGASAALAGLGQDRVLTTIRNTEVVSDSTNILALEAATRRRELKGRDARSAEPVHLAASHRLLRTQRYDNPSLSSHFKVFSLCSAGRDRGSFQCEIDALTLHIQFYLSALRAYLGDGMPLRVSLTLLDPSQTLSAAADQVLSGVREKVRGVEVVLAPDRAEGREYYRTFSFWIHGMGDPAKPVHLVDGGCTDWTQRLLGDSKERLVISGIGSDRVVLFR